MDGNGRWAKQHNLPNIAGHKAGAKTAEKIIRAAANLGIKYLTLYTFSSENWLRDSNWLSDFFYLLDWYLKNQISVLHEHNIRFRVIGDISKFPQNIQTLIQKSEDKTLHNTGMTVILALSYSGRDEIVRATNKILKESKNKHIESINAEDFKQYLDTADTPDPDLLIRTSGEQRISNFLLWQIAYAEFVFVDALWPNFTVELLEDAINAYDKRERRYGKDKI